MAEELLINVGIGGASVTQLTQEVDKFGNVVTTTGQDMDKLGQSSKDVESKQESLRTQIRKGREELSMMSKGTAEYAAKLQEVAGKQQIFNRINKELKASQATLGQTMSNVNNVVGGLAGGFSVATGVMNLFGVESEGAMKALIKMQSLMSITSGLASLNTAMRSFDGLKAVFGDLFISAKKSIVPVVEHTAAEVGDTAAVVINTEAQVVNAEVQTIVGKVMDSNAIKLLKQIGTLIIYAAIIYAAVAAVTALIEWLNKIPKDLEIKLKLNDESYKKLADTQTKITQFQKDYDKAIREHDSNRINQLDKYAQKEYSITDIKLKEIKKVEKGWDKFFSNYIDTVRKVAFNEARIREGAQVEYEGKKYQGEQELLKEQISNSLKLDGKNKEYINNFMLALKKGNVDFSLASAHGVSKEVDMYNEANNKIIENNKKLLILNQVKLYDIKNISTTPEPIKTKTEKEGRKTTNGSIVDFSTPLTTKEIFEKINKEVKEGLQKGRLLTERETLLLNVALSKSENDRLNSQYKLSVFDIENSTKSAGEKYEALKELKEKYDKEDLVWTKESIDKEFKHNQDAYDSGLISYEAFLKQKSFLQKKYSEPTKKNDEEIAQNFLKNASIVAQGVGDSMNAISGIYEENMEITNARFDNEKRNIENSTKYQSASSTEQQQIMFDLETKRYASLKKDFENKKKFDIGVVAVDALKNEMTLLSSAIGHGLFVGNPIAIAELALGTIANTVTAATTISKINARKLEAPTPPTTGAVNTGVVATSVEPTQTSLTSTQENLNIMSKSGQNTQTSVVKVSDINKVQKTVDVRDNNSSY